MQSVWYEKARVALLSHLVQYQAANTIYIEIEIQDFKSSFSALLDHCVCCIRSEQQQKTLPLPHCLWHNKTLITGY